WRRQRRKIRDQPIDKALIVQFLQPVQIPQGQRIVDSGAVFLAAISLVCRIASIVGYGLTRNFSTMESTCRRSSAGSVIFIRRIGAPAAISSAASLRWINRPRA